MIRIDAVITWVNGNDPVHKRKRASYGSTAIFDIENIAGSARYNDSGEIFWCVASINRFAPFINKIYIVTDEQDPQLDDFLERTFPQSYIPYEIIDHKTIFEGYEEYLPTFNSVSIESMTWRIPGLSEYFIEFNDDMMLGAPVKPEDFFLQDGTPVCYAEKVSLLWIWLTRKIKRKVNGVQPVTFKGLMMNAAFMTGKKSWMLRIDHTPRALRKSFYSTYFSSHPDALLRNIRHRFRDTDQYNPQALQFLSLYADGKCILRPIKGYLSYIYPKRKKDYVKNKIVALRASKTRFICFNSIDQASDEDMVMVREFVSGLLSIDL